MKNKFTTIRTKLVWALLIGAGMASLCMLLLCVIMLLASNNMNFAVFFLKHVIEFIILFLLVFSILTILFFLLLVKGKIKYLEEIRTNLEEISEGNLDIHIPVRTNDELGLMAQTVNDMTFRLKKSIDEERVMEKTKNDLITSVSHDLRTPLTSILGYLELINQMQEADSQKLARYSKIALKQCTDLKNLVDGLFEFTKLNNADVKLNLIQVNLAELLEQVILGFIPAFQEAGMEYRLFFPKNKVVVFADPLLLTRVFDNLIRNAILYGNDGKYVDIKLLQESNEAIVRIIDYGQEIQPSDITHVFERLYRVDQSATTSSGTGIGLAIVKSIVELHKGTVSVTSTKHETAFEVRLVADCGEDIDNIDIK